eukprot:TRINITY_DN20260_c0_g1_i1.p1 TRINITY_DN20260_c0_g1~~TRINITY_DN20260_c0_g1_i1.p1  ORF type:complete len:204 (+),score=44.85 TRINITY_DN20260_c0_g1_i1:123-734(+)
MLQLAPSALPRQAGPKSSMKVHIDQENMVVAPKNKNLQSGARLFGNVESVKKTVDITRMPLASLTNLTNKRNQGEPTAKKVVLVETKPKTTKKSVRKEPPVPPPETCNRRSRFYSLPDGIPTVDFDIDDLIRPVTDFPSAFNAPRPYFDEEAYLFRNPEDDELLRMRPQLDPSMFEDDFLPTLETDYESLMPQEDLPPVIEMV